MREKYSNENDKTQEAANGELDSKTKGKGNRLLDRLERGIPPAIPLNKPKINEFEKKETARKNNYKGSLFTNRNADIRNPKVAQRVIARQVLDRQTKFPPEIQIPPPKEDSNERGIVVHHLNLSPLYNESATLTEIDKVFKTESPDAKVAHDLIRAHRTWIVKRHFDKFVNPDHDLAIALIKAGEKDFVEANKRKFKGFDADPKSLNLDSKKMKDSSESLNLDAGERVNKIQNQQFPEKPKQQKTSEGKKLSLNPRKENDDKLMAQKG